MIIKNITKILITLIIILFLATTESNAGMGQQLLEDFIKNFDTEASEEEQEKYVESWVDTYANWEQGLEALESYATRQESSWFSSRETKEKCRMILERIESARNARNASGVGGNYNNGTETNDGDGNVSSGEGSFSDWQHQAENFISMGKQNQTITTQDAITTLLPAGRLLVGIATIVLVIVGSIMGVKYMISGANEKAQLKQKLIYYVISVVLVYGAVGIFTLVVGLMNSILA